MAALSFIDRQTCPLCRHRCPIKLKRIKDRFSLTHRTFSLAYCHTCQFGFTTPQPTGAIASLYPDTYFGPADHSSPLGYLAQWYNRNHYRFDLDLITQATGLEPSAWLSYLDIGCGTGDRVRYYNSLGARLAHGIDLHSPLPHHHFSAPVSLVKQDPLTLRPRQKYQMISLFHVLEHVKAPLRLLGHLRSALLTKNGYVVIQVPNYASSESQILGPRWSGLDIPRHVWHFTPKSLTITLARSGLTPVALWQCNAPLHPITLVPSLLPSLDIGVIYTQQRSTWARGVLTSVWAGLTLVSLPLNLAMNLVQKNSILTVVARKI